MENGSGRPRRSTAIYGTRLSDINTTRRILTRKAPSSMDSKSIIANSYGSKFNATASTSNSNKETKTTETNTNNMEVSLTEENLLLNQDNIIEENTDNITKAINKTKKDEKGKEKEINTETDEENNETTEKNVTSTETDDIESLNSEDSFLSEHEEWRKKINFQKYKVWIKTGEVMGKNLKDKIDMIANLLNKNNINIITIKTEKNLEDKKLYIAIYLGKKEDVEKACKIEIEGTQLNDRSTLTRAAINQNKKTNNEKGIKFWDIPIGMQEQEFKSMLKNKFGNVTSCSMSTRGVWSSAIVQFKKEDTAENLLMEWSQIIGEESCRVTSPTCNFTKLKERGKYAVKIINLPPDITARELYNMISPLGAKTCYFPRNLYGKKKRMAIASFESQEGKDQVINYGWTAGEFKVKIVDTTSKTCHRCHAEDHLVISCPVAQKQKEISERKARDFEKYGHLYKRQRPQLYRSLAEGINMGTSYADAVRNNTNRRFKQNSTEINDSTNKDIMKILQEIQQDVQEIKEQMTDINGRLELVEDHCAHELLNDAEVEGMDTSDEENEEKSVEKSKIQPVNVEGKKIEETINYIYETVKSLLEDNKKTQARLIGVENQIGAKNIQGGDIPQV